MLLYFLPVFLSDKPVDLGYARVENKGAYLTRVLVRFQNPQGEDQLRDSGFYPVFQSRLIIQYRME